MSRVESMPQSSAYPSAWNRWEVKLWLQWVLAHTVGEVVGLGLAGAVGTGLALLVGEPQSVFVALLLAVFMIALGTFEGIVVGWAQWLVLRRRLLCLRQSAWVMATAIGAFVAWTLGMAPSTLLALTQSNDSTPPPVVSDAVRYALAAVMGAVLGMILGLPQWRVLRHHVNQAGWWVLANAAAWLVGMPLVFVGAGATPIGATALSTVLLVVLTIAATGAVVGAIHGLVLLWLLRNSRACH